MAPFEIEDIRQADAIFSGKHARFERASAGRPNSLDDFALLTVRVDRVVKWKVSEGSALLVELDLQRPRNRRDLNSGAKI